MTTERERFEACETPLHDLLRQVPRDHQLVIEGHMSSHHIPVGELCHKAAAALAAERQPLDDESIMFDHVYCSQCGGDFGRGYHGYSHCEDHRERPVSAEPQRPLDDEGKTT